MQEVFRLIDRVGPTEASVLLTGESGSGKELAAQSIHDRSLRRGGPFLAINCGAIPAGLIEAELFGYEKGSFTGAVRAHAGVFERADGGTLLLDEITEMPLEMQTRLLRVLETRRFYRVGANVELSTDVRVIAASNRCPLQAVRSGQLREDLLYRLAVFPIELPPLRSRGNDVELLAGHFLDELNAQAGTHKQLTAHSRMTLKQHSWPGNVRELRNCIERAFILGDQCARAGAAHPIAGLTGRGMPMIGSVWRSASDPGFTTWSARSSKRRSIISRATSAAPRTPWDAV